MAHCCLSLDMSHVTALLHFLAAAGTTPQNYFTELPFYRAKLWGGEQQKWIFLYGMVAAELPAVHLTMVYVWATLRSSVQPWASPKERIPRQLEGWSCFMRKLQHTSMTWESCRRHAAASKLSMVSSFNSRIPGQFAFRTKKIWKFKFKSFPLYFQYLKPCRSLAFLWDVQCFTNPFSFLAERFFK